MIQTGFHSTIFRYRAQGPVLTKFTVSKTREDAKPLEANMNLRVIFVLPTGKVNSLYGVCEALMPLVYGPTYSAVYAATMHSAPGAFFLLGGGLTTPAVIIFM